MAETNIEYKEIDYTQYEKYDEMNIPITLRNKENLEEYDKGTVKFILSNRYFSSPAILSGQVGEGKFYEKIKVFVDGFYLNLFKEDWLSQSIEGKNIYVMLKGNRSRMPCNPAWFKIQGGFLENLFNSLPEYYVKINFSLGEKTMADLLSNSFKYYYDENLNQYLAHTLEEQEKQKYVYINKLAYFKTKGYEFEEIDEIKEMLKFLFKKIEPNLTKEEKNEISEFIKKEVDHKKISAFIKKDQSFEKFNKKNK